MILAGDIGGTKTLLCIARDGAVVTERSYASAQYHGLEAMLQTFFREIAAQPADIGSACFAIAGPVHPLSEGNQCAKVTNLPWEITTHGLRSILPTTRMRLVNDFYAAGHGIASLGPEDVAVLQEPKTQEPRAPKLVLGAGTGLGMAQLVWTGCGYDVLASEGGHIHFAPTDDLQNELLIWMRGRYSRVSYERLVSGLGLANIYAFLHMRSGGDQAQLDTVLADADPAAHIATLARAGTDPVAQHALTLFIRIYGAVAGDIALVTLAGGGVYLAGGIAPKILPEIHQDNLLLQAFNDKGRMSNLVRRMPLYVVLNSKIGLIGAVRIADSFKSTL